MKAITTLAQAPAVRAGSAVAGIGFDLWSVHDLLVGLSRADLVGTVVAIAWLLPWTRVARAAAEKARLVCRIGLCLVDA